MREARTLVVASLIAGVASALYISPTAAYAAGAAGNVNVLFGQKQLAQDTSDDLKTQDEFGVQMSFGGGEWPVMIAVDMGGSAGDDSVTFEDEFFDTHSVEGKIRTYELALGVRKFWRAARGHVQPYVGGGPAGIRGQVSIHEAVDDGYGTTFSASDSWNTFGAWGGGGVMFRLGKGVNLGLDAHYTWAAKPSDGQDLKFGGVHYGFGLGWGW